ncbi:MAG TPA: hypothetical protein EYP28_06520 [Methanophagales archaeon]|nr:hypothetical protein [Methanophagales archaeon]
MNKKLVVAVIAMVVVMGLLAGCAEKPAPEEATPAPTITPTAKPTVKPTAPPSMEMMTSCDMCHKTESTANLNAHVKGGLLVAGKPGCFNYWGCHGIGNATVHTVHPPEVGCAACHGTETPAIPPKGPGGTTCELCHAEPYPLEPSDGRLVEIHLDRGKDCTVCHVGEISEIHGLK